MAAAGATRADETARLGVIAGAGNLPLAVARAARDAGRDVFVLTVDGVTDADFEGFAHGRTALTAVGRAVSELKRARCRDIVAVGTFKRPDHARLDWDWGTLKAMPRLLQIRFGGDNSVNSIVASLFEAHGFRVVSPSDVAPALLAAGELRIGRAPTSDERSDIDLGFRAIAALGAFDVGQAVVVSHHRILAVEAAEGTDAMIARCGDLRREGRFREAPPSGVLVKAAKPGQDLRMDLPVVGVRTVEAAAASGLAGLALHEGHVLVPEVDEVRQAAERHGLFVVTLPMPAGPTAGD